MPQFSEYVSHFNTPLPVHSYVNSLRDSLNVFLDPQHGGWEGLPCAFSALPSPTQSSVSPSVPDVPFSTSPRLGTLFHSIDHTPAPDRRSCNSPASTRTPLPPPSPARGRSEQVEESHPDACGEAPPTGAQGQVEQGALPLEIVGGRGAGGKPENPSNAEEPASSTMSNLLSQLQPEVISNLVKIIEGVQKNTVHFYIHSTEEESDVCWEIKEYLKRLGNSECHPQTFLENKDGQDKLLIIIQNIDIASHVHEIPALVSLKKLPSVSFAGVDTTDDIKNHTYNELFVSGGFIVSDELVLNPDFITQDKLQALLQYLEELNTPESPWRWRVHCKTHKKVKEQSRSKSEALSVLNLLTTYHKKQIVEFLSYHECDAQSRHAPDLECLVKLQAQNIRQRHVIFLTERRFEMFPHYSSSGIVIANIDDILYNMASLIGEACDRQPSSDLPPCPTSPTLREEDVGSDVEGSARRGSALQDRASTCTDQDADLSADPHLCASRHTVEDDASALHPLPSSTCEPQKALDFEALKAAISQFRVARMQANSSGGHLSPGSRPINPQQSFLSQTDMLPAHEGSRSCLSTSSFVPHASTPLDQMQAARQQEHTFILESAADAQMHAARTGQAEMGSSAKCSTMPLDGSQVEVCPQPSDVLSVHGVVEPGASVLSAGANFVAATDTQPPWSRTSETDPPTETPANPALCETEGNRSQDKTASEVVASINPVFTTSLATNLHKINTVSTANGKHNNNNNSRAGLLPMPGTVAYSLNNALASVDRMVLQGASLWPGPPGPLGLNSHGLPSQNGALGLRSQILNRAMTNSLGMAASQAGFRGLLPNNGMQVAWNSLAPGTASNVWGLQQGLRTQFVQSYAWQGNPSFQGNGYPPRRGGYGGW